MAGHLSNSEICPIFYMWVLWGKKKLHMNNITDETRLERFLQKKKTNFLLKSNTSLLNNNNINKGVAKGILYTVSF